VLSATPSRTSSVDAVPASAPGSLPPQVSPPRFELSEEPLGALAEGSVVALPVLPPADAEATVSLGPGAAGLVEELGVDLLAVLDHHDATGKAGEVVAHTVIVPGGVAEVVCVGVGGATPADLRTAGAALARAVKDRDVVATTVPSVAGDEGLRAFVVGATLGSFEFHWRSEGPKAQPVRLVVLPATPSGTDVVERATAIAAAGWRARALATTPSNLKNPAWLAEQAVAAGQEAGLEVTVWDEQRLADDGFGGILAVGRASATPPRLVRMDYRPSRRRRLPHVVLVGKGITFDTGGLSIKPGEAMVNMKRDMTGGAVVIATMAALGAVGCPVRVTGLVASAENAIGGSAQRPGDVVTHFGGRTTEVTNTDAEGRLVLADAMAYAVAKLQPDVLVDVATLTGAMKVALGLRTGGFFANHHALAGHIAEAAAAAGEPLWRMPLAADYEEKLASKVADADNGAGHPGAITAALFLQHFAGDVPWAHLDVASVGDSPEENAEWTTGPTGFGARALLHWLERDEPTKGV
jgi:leucyl aminopeptidase